MLTSPQRVQQDLGLAEEVLRGHERVVRAATKLKRLDDGARTVQGAHATNVLHRLAHRLGLEVAVLVNHRANHLVHELL